MDCKYYTVRTTSRVDGSDIRDHLGPHFGNPQKVSQCNEAIVLHCRVTSKFAQYTWRQHVQENPRLKEFVFRSGDRPSFLPADCENIPKHTLRTLVRTRGDKHSKWSRNQ